MALEGEFNAEQSSLDSGSTASSTKKVKGKYANTNPSIGNVESTQDGFTFSASDEAPLVSLKASSSLCIPKDQDISLMSCWTVISHSTINNWYTLARSKIRVLSYYLTNIPWVTNKYIGMST